MRRDYVHNRRQLQDPELVQIITAQREDTKTGKFVQTLGSRKLWIRLRGLAGPGASSPRATRRFGFQINTVP